MICIYVSLVIVASVVIVVIGRVGVVGRKTLDVIIVDVIVIDDRDVILLVVASVSAPTAAVAVARVSY